MKKSIPAALLTLTLAGCTIPAEPNFSAVQIGMDKAQLQAAVGNPDEIHTITTPGSSEQQLVYFNHGNPVYIYFNGRVSAIQD
jgi:hypothetical protein